MVYGLIGLIVVWAAMWKFFGLGSGRKFGNKIADHIGMSNNLFHSALEQECPMPSLRYLHGLERSGCTVELASLTVAPLLDMGLSALEARFGKQNEIDAIRPTIEDLLDRGIRAEKRV